MTPNIWFLTDGFSSPRPPTLRSVTTYQQQDVSSASSDLIITLPFWIRASTISDGEKSNLPSLSTERCLCLWWVLRYGQAFIGWFTGSLRPRYEAVLESTSMSDHSLTTSVLERRFSILGRNQLPSRVLQTELDTSLALALRCGKRRWRWFANFS